MNARSPIRILAVTALATALLAAAVWSVGFFYWHVSIKRAIAVVMDPARRLKFTSGGVVRPEVRHFHLPGADSRAIPYLLRATDDAAANQDLQLMTSLIIDLGYAVARADRKAGDDEDIDPSRKIVLPTGGLSVEYVLQDHLANREWWIREQHKYPPWWMWWSGKQRSK